MSTKVKICGITNPADAAVAVAAGADALGFIFCATSPRLVSVATAAAIAAGVPPHVLRVGVFVNPAEELVQSAIAGCGLNLLQFHGDEPPEFCTQFGIMSMKALRVRDAGSLAHLEQFHTDAFLLDAYSAKGLGGTGETFNWELAIAAKQLGRPIFLAGGLTPENVAEAVRQVQPFGVDVSSGVEASPGKKDHAKVRAFIAAVRAADRP